MACGNEIDEGETGETYDALLIVPMTYGYVDAGVDNKNVKHHTIEDFTFTFQLAASYPVGVGCVINIKWDSANFVPSVVVLNNKQYISALQESTSELNFTVKNKIDAGQDIRISFQDTYVLTEVSATEGEALKDFITSVNVIGNWVVYGGQTGNGADEGQVYRCESLNDIEGGENCGLVKREDVLVTVENRVNTNKVNSVKVSPNNIRV